MPKKKRKFHNAPAFSSGTLLIYGRNPVKAAIEAKKIEHLFISNKHKDEPLVRKALSLGIEVGYLDDMALGNLAQSASHQGYVAICPEIPTYTLEGLLASINKDDPLLLMLDGIQDPVNLGSLLRSADAFGVDGIIIKSRGASPITSSVARVSTGAYNFVPIAIVNNLSQALVSLKAKGYWVTTTDMDGTLNYDEVDYNGKCVIVIGSEGFGVSRLVKENSDFVAKIPMVGHVNSLNAAVAGAIFLAAASSKRRK